MRWISKSIYLFQRIFHADIIIFSLLFVIFLTCLKVGLFLIGNGPMFADSALNQAQRVVDSVSSNAWDFGKPLLQLVVVLALGEWFVTRLGLKVSLIELGSINIQTFIAIAIVFTFCLAALGDLPGLIYLKDVVLIVIGFYFGTRSRKQSDDESLYRKDTFDKKSDV